MLGEFILGSVEKLVMAAIARGTNYIAADFFQRRRVDRAVETASANVAETLVTFFGAEGVSEDDQRLIIDACVEELSPISADPSILFEGSLNGQVIFELRFASRSLPRSVTDSDLQGAFEMAFVRVATLLCTVPAGVKDWESNAWAENYRRLDLIAADIKTVFDRVDAIKGSDGGAQDISAVRKYLAQKLAVTLDVTGLRAEKVVHRSMDDMFVHPSIVSMVDRRDGELPDVVETDDQYFSKFCARGFLGVIVGAPGSGKSTWSRWFQRKALSDSWDGIALRIELRGVDFDDDPSIVDLLKGAVGSNYADRLDFDFVDRLVRKERLLIIFDGFDEVSLENRDRAIEWIHSSVSYARGCPAIITSRPLTTSHVENVGRSWTKWSIQPFDLDRVVEYITRWYSGEELTEGAAVPDAQELAEQWRSDATIGPLTGNPLLLSTLLMVHHLDGSLPAGRSELYDRYIKGMLGVWDERRRVRREALTISLDTKRAVLADIALDMITTGRDQLEESDILSVVTASLRRIGEQFDPRAVIEHLRERSGLIVGPGVYNFSHKTIGEFLVAQMVVQGDRYLNTGDRLDTFKLFELRNDDRWNAVLFLWSGLAPLSGVESFIRQCADAGDPDISFGILLDQYDRFVPSAKEAILDYLRPSLNGMRFDDKSVWALGASMNSVSKGSSQLDQFSHGPVTIIDAQIRGITSRENVGIRALFDRLMSDDLLPLDGARGYVGAARKAIWMVGAMRARPGGGIQRSLATIPYRTGKPRMQYWMMERQVSQFLMPRDNAYGISIISDAIKEIVDADNRIAPMIGIAIMSTSVRRMMSVPNSWISAISSRSSRLLILHTTSWSPDALLLSLAWRAQSLTNVERSVQDSDLLAAYRQRLLHSLSVNGPNQDVDRALNFVAELESTRSHLVRERV